MLMSLEHIEYAIFGVLKMIPVLDAHFEVFFHMFHYIFLHGQSCIPSIIDFDEVLTEFNAFIFQGRSDLLFVNHLLFGVNFFFFQLFLLFIQNGLNDTFFPVIFIFSRWDERGKSVE
jgi:hypothetical protein